MRATNLGRLFFFLFLLLNIGCSSTTNLESAHNDSLYSENQDNNEIPSSFDKNYIFLESSSKVKDRNFYWTTVVESVKAINKLLKNDPELHSFLNAAKSRLIKVANSPRLQVDEYANFLKFTKAEKARICQAIVKIVEANEEFGALTRNHVEPSGAFIRYKSISNNAVLHEMIVRDLLNGINNIIDVYGTGIDPRYPNLDKISYDVNSREYQNMVKVLVDQLNENNQDISLFYQPFLKFALGLLDLNNRDEAGRFVPLAKGENAAAIKYLKSIDWKGFKYSMILVLGDAPNSPGDLPNISIGGMKRADHGVELYKKGLAPIIAFSGGNVAPFQTRYYEAIEMKKYVMEKYGISENHILVDPHARHTTTNMRNVGRQIFRYGFPKDKKAIVSTAESQSEYVGSDKFKIRCMEQMGYVPMDLYNRLSDFDQEFTPSVDVLYLDSSDPLDP